MALEDSKVTTPLVLRLYAFLCIPLACWQMWIFPNIPNYYAQHLFIYPTLLFMAWAWLHRLWTLGEVWLLLCRALPWLLLLFALQALAGWQSAQQYAPLEPVAPRVLQELFKLAAQLPFLLLLILLGRVLMANSEARRYMLKGALFSFAVLMLLCAVQGVFIYTKGSQNALFVWLQQASRQFLLSVSPWLEARWLSSVYDFYREGSYALTTRRINGLFEEASALCVMLGVFFVPLAFGLLALSKNKGRIAGWVMLLLCLETAILCKAVSGIALAGLILLCLFFMVLPRLRSKTKLFLVLMFVLLCGATVFLSSNVRNYLNAHTKERSPRVVITLDTLDMIAEHPFLGVGRGWFAPHQHEGQRYLKRLDNIELATWKERGTGMELSALPALAAQYGLPLVLAALIFIGVVWRRLQLLQKAKPNDFNCFMASACTAWVVLAFVLSTSSLDIRNPLFCLPFFCFWAAALTSQKED